MKKIVNVYLSAEPYHEFSREVLRSPFLKGVRCNTGAFVTESKVKVLQNFQARTYPIETWVDLKCRELRNIKDATIPYDYLELNHKIRVKTPTALYYNEGKNYVIIDEIINGDKIVVKTPGNFTGRELIKFGKGCSLNIPDDSLKIDGYLTSTDKEYIEAAKKNNIHNYFLSFVESGADLKLLLHMDPEANIFAKIESKKGLQFIQNDYHQFSNRTRLIAARADLYIELDHPHEILDAMKKIILEDPKAIAASHILESFIELDKVPRSEDIGDLGFLIEIGYHNFLLGDELCQNEDALLSVMGFLTALNT